MSNAIAHLNGRPRGSTWVANHTLYPYPAYEAHFFDGTVGRVTFWQETGKPWDVLRARNLATAIYGKTIERGFIEYDKPGDPWVRVLDLDVYQHTPQRAKRGPTAAQLKKLLQRVLDDDNAAVREAQELLAA